MATIPLKDITFPGLDNTYTIPEIDDTLSTAGKAADAKKVGDELASASDDITALQSGKANVDGYYADLVSGGSTQLLSDMVETDTTPYNYRTAGGSLEIGDREKLKKIVGVSATANQLVQNGNFANTDNWSATNATGFSVSDGVASFTPTALYGNIHQFLSGKPLKANHVILCIGDMKADGALENCQLAISDNVNFTRAKTVTLGTAWQTVFLMIKETTVAYSNNHAVTFRTVLTSDFAKMYVKNAIVIDLTAMFGSTIADYVYSLETATAGAGVAWLKAHFPRIFNAGYIPYNAGELVSVQASAHKMTGFNQWDEEWELGGIANADGAKYTDNARIRSKNYIPVFPSTTYYFKMPSAYSQFKLVFYDADKTFISYTAKKNETFVIPANCHYMMIAENATDYGTTYNHDICINLHWDGERDGTYEPYEEHSYPLDSDVTLRGIPKLDANNNLYYDGDEYASDGTVTRKYGIVDLGTLTWSYVTDDNYAGEPYFATGSTNKLIGSANLICDEYTAAINRSQIQDKVITQFNSTNSSALVIRDDSYTDATAFKTALSGVMLVYELATPTTESADPYTEIQNVSNWGTEEFVTTSLVPVGHETAYQPDLRAKIEVAPESPDTDGMYLMKRENGQNSYVAYLGELPSDPTTDGTYTLKCTVASGTATKTWEADT